MKFKIILLTLCLLVCSNSYGLLISFENITNNDSSGQTDISINNQIHGELIQVNATQVRFTINNQAINTSSIDPCFIAQIYFDDRANALSSFSSVSYINPSGVGFAIGTATPPNLPGGNTLSPAFSPTYVFGAYSPSSKWGVNHGESISIVFNLSSGKSFSDIEKFLLNKDLRIGMHVQGFKGGYSEGLINTTNKSMVPEPMTLGMIGLGSLVFLNKRKRK